MTEQEKQEIVSEVEKQIMSKMKGSLVKEDTQSVLSEPRDKWFRKGTARYSGSLMYNVFGSYIYWCVWEIIRKLTCYICGTGYVRNLQGNEKAAEIAEKLCQTVYDLRTEYTDEQKNEK
jgi:hypothetical protein